MELTDRKELYVRSLVDLASFVVMLYVAKKLMQPDVARTLKMRGALMVKRVADRQVDTWGKLSRSAATAYQKARV